MPSLSWPMRKMGFCDLVVRSIAMAIELADNNESSDADRYAMLMPAENMEASAL